MRQFTRAQATPVIAKGTSYGSWPADSLAAPSLCWDGTRFVATVSLWDNTATKWASAFFTSADLLSWTYVASSLRTPSSGNYIFGNAGIEWFGGAYWLAYNEYPSNSSGPANVSHSTDLVTWTDLGSVVPHTTGEDALGQLDPSLRYNPHSGLLECWFIGGNNRRALMADSPDGTTWTARGVFLAGTSPYVTNFGEPEVFFYDGSRYILFDGASAGGHRFVFGARSPTRDTTWLEAGSHLGPTALNAWESVQTFDGCCAGAFDLGAGLRFYALYAGTDGTSTTDNTNSSIGIAYQDVPLPPPPPTAVEPWFLEKRNFTGSMRRAFDGGMQR